jgi:hypothetical protein
LAPGDRRPAKERFAMHVLEAALVLEFQRRQRPAQLPSRLHRRPPIRLAAPVMLALAFALVAVLA